MPFKKGKSVKDANKNVINAIESIAIGHVKDYLNTFLDADEMERISIEVGENGNPLVIGDETVLRKIKENRESNI